MDSSILKRPFAVVAFFAVIGMGYFHLNRGIDEIQTAELSESWPSVTGIVVASSVTSTGGGEDGRHAEYFANVRYRYSVGGLAHEASRVSFGVPHRGSGFAYSVVERYPKGKSVTVFYDAVRPSEARLEPAPLLSGSYMAIVFGGLLILIPGAIGFLYIWQWTEDLWKRLRAPVR